MEINITTSHEISLAVVTNVCNANNHNTDENPQTEEKTVLKRCLYEASKGETAETKCHQNI